MRLPDSGGDFHEDNPVEEKYVPPEGTEYIMNPYYGKQMLSRRDAINAINMLAGMLLIDGDNRWNK